MIRKAFNSFRGFLIDGYWIVAWLLFVTILIVALSKIEFGNSKKEAKLTAGQVFAIENIKDELKREAFRDCILYSTFYTCYKDLMKKGD